MSNLFGESRPLKNSDILNMFGFCVLNWNCNDPMMTKHAAYLKPHPCTCIESLSWLLHKTQNAIWNERNAAEYCCPFVLQLHCSMRSHLRHYEKPDIGTLTESFNFHQTLLINHYHQEYEACSWFSIHEW